MNRIHQIISRIVVLTAFFTININAIFSSQHKLIVSENTIVTIHGTVTPDLSSTLNCFRSSVPSINIIIDKNGEVVTSISAELLRRFKSGESINFTDVINDGQIPDKLTKKYETVGFSLQDGVFKLAKVYSKCDGVVPIGDKANHAGVSYWRGRTSVNNFSVGIELVTQLFCMSGESECRAVLLDPMMFASSDYYWQPFSNSQIDALVDVLKVITNAFVVDPWDVVGHADVAPHRKLDPGPIFPYKRLAEEGFGMWPDDDLLDLMEQLHTIQDSGSMKSSAREMLSQLGYCVDISSLAMYNSGDTVRLYRELIEAPARANRYRAGEDYFLKCAISAFKMHYYEFLLYAAESLGRGTDRLMALEADVPLVLTLLSLKKKYPAAFGG